MRSQKSLADPSMSVFPLQPLLARWLCRTWKELTQMFNGAAPAACRLSSVVRVGKEGLRCGISGKNPQREVICPRMVWPSKSFEKMIPSLIPRTQNDAGVPSAKQPYPVQEHIPSERALRHRGIHYFHHPSLHREVGTDDLKFRIRGQGRAALGRAVFKGGRHLIE